MKILGDAWKYGMVGLATLHLMTNTHNHVNGTYWDILSSPLTTVFQTKSTEEGQDNDTTKSTTTRNANDSVMNDDSFLLSTRLVSLKTDNTLKLLVQCAALYSFHFDYLLLYLNVRKNSIAILNDHLPLFLTCLKIGMNRKQDSNESGLNGLYSAQEIRAMGLSPKFKNFPKHLTDVDAVKKIVQIAIFLKRKSSNLHEKVDTEAHLQLLQDMLLKIFNCSAFSSYKTLEKFQKPHHYQHSIVRVAHVFHSGPMADLFEAKISSITNTGNISPIIDHLFWGFLRNKFHYTGTEKRLHILTRFRKALFSLHILGFGTQLLNLPNSKRNVAELTSDLINIRYNPASMFCLEGLSKAIYLSLLVSQAIGREDTTAAFHFAIILMIAGTLLTELGEYQGDLIFPTFSIPMTITYFKSKWNCLDCVGLSLNIAGLVIEFHRPHSPVPKALYAVAIICVSLAMLRYISVYEPLGQLVEMVFAQLIDIVKFFIIFCLATFGFFIALFTLAHTQPSNRFRTKSLTIDTLFDSAFANYDSFDVMFSDFDNPHRKLSMILFMIYVTFSGVVLLNLVIARMSATHDKLDAVALEQWKFNRAKIVRSYLLLNERSPYSMLPPPFNLVSTVIALLTSLPRFFWFRWCLAHDKSLDGLVIISTAGTFSDFLLAFVMSFIAPLIEIGWSLYQITWTEGFRMILCYPLYVVSLLLETTQLRTQIVFSQEALATNHFPVLYPEVMTPSPCATVISAVNSADIVQSKSHISIKIVRIQVEALKDQSKVPIIEVRLQNIVSYLEESILEGNTFRFVKSTVTFPVEQLDFSDNNFKLRIRVYNRNLKTNHDDILSRVTIPSGIMKTWVANGRFEGPLPFNTTHPDEVKTVLQDGECKGQDMVQIVFKTKIQKTDNIESLFHICEEGFSCKKPNRRGISKVAPPPQAPPPPPSCSTTPLVRQPTISLALEVRKLSEKCIKKRQMNSIFTHEELQKLFDVDDYSVRIYYNECCYCYNMLLCIPLLLSHSL